MVDLQLDAAMNLANDGLIVEQNTRAEFRLDDTVLRQEVVGTAVTLYGATLPNDYSCKGYYTDLTSMSPNGWSCRAFEIGADIGIVTKANAQARPESQITRAEALAMVMASEDFMAGRSSIQVDSMANGWQTDLLRTAVEAGILANALNFGPNELATRGEVFVWANKVQNPEDRFEFTVEVGGAAMYPSKNIIENAINSDDHTTLVAAVMAADLVATLEGPGPFTVFAPTNDAFAKLPAGTVDTLLMTENKAMLQTVLTYHVLSGTYSAADIMADIQTNAGVAVYDTVSGDKVMARMQGGAIVLIDENGTESKITTSNVFQSNGVIHVVDTVIQPK